MFTEYMDIHKIKSTTQVRRSEHTLKAKVHIQPVRVDEMRPSQFIVFISEFSGRDETVFILVFVFENILHHGFVMRVVWRVAVFCKLLFQVLLHL